MLTFDFMKRYIMQIIVFFLLVFVVDFVAGKSFSYLIEHAKGGDNKRNNYICNEINQEILVFGSSRAEHHYNPLIISDSLGLSCYNCGQGGMGAILNYARYQLIIRRYHPKMVFYEVTPSFDLLSKEDNHKFLKWIRAYYGKPGIPEVFESVDSKEKYKMLSRMYRYNTNFLQIISDYLLCFHPAVLADQNSKLLEKTPLCITIIDKRSGAVEVGAVIPAHPGEILHDGNSILIRICRSTVIRIL